jgi:hypothetical protein
MEVSKKLERRKSTTHSQEGNRYKQILIKAHTIVNLRTVETKNISENF